jgi:hypothetical protein
MFDSYAYGAGGSTTADIINLGNPLPPGALILDVIVNHNAWGGSGAINLGYVVSTGDTDAASATAFFSALSMASAATVRLTDTTYNAATGLYKLFSSAPAAASNQLAPQIQVQAVVSTGGAAQASTLAVAVYYLTY